MLKQLHIRNYAIIDLLDIRFTSHLNIITGETGAGKSILMGALSLILGERADTSSLLNKEEKCIVEGSFNGSEKVIRDFLKENDLDEDEEIVIRREISANGKSRAFINDTPVTLQQLKKLSGLLVDLHRQFDTQNLNDANFQLEVLDALALHDELLNDYKSNFRHYKSLQGELNRLIEEQNAANKEFDYHKFLLDELEEANFSENEIEDLDQELKMMSNAENIKATLSAVIFTLNESESPLIDQLRSVISKVGQFRDVHPSLSAVEERLQSAWIEMKDILGELEQINDDVSFSEERLNEMNARMDKAYTLLKKHQVQNTAELLAIAKNLQGQLQKATDLTLEIEQKQNEFISLEKKLRNLATVIHKNRQSQVDPFEKQVNKLLHQVGMPNAKLKVEIGELTSLGPLGTDEVEFLFNANKAGFQPVKKVASGGELSRLMLIIKSLVAKSMRLPTLIFDEIDTGISGEAARQVGNIMQDLAREHQILLITHQPQIAAKAHTHFFVYKELKAGQVKTSVKQLDKDERINAIATMLSGEKPTAAAVANAREMMK